MTEGDKRQKHDERNILLLNLETFCIHHSRMNTSKFGVNGPFFTAKAGKINTNYFVTACTVHTLWITLTIQLLAYSAIIMVEERCLKM